MSLTVENFISIKEFILRFGDQRTYCNRFSHNPHFSFPGFDAFLDPEEGKYNIGCDPSLSDFDELVVQDQDTDEVHFSIKNNAEKNRLEFSREHKKSLRKYFEIMLAEVEEMPFPRQQTL